VSTGLETYGKYCAACHGDRGQSRGANFPDLTRTPLLHTQEGFDDVVLKGVRSEKGMGSFASSLQPADTVALRAYLTSRANEVKNAPPPAPPGASPPPRTGNQHEQ
jgi:mono/diheme cytochrome c family protein